MEIIIVLLVVGFILFLLTNKSISAKKKATSIKKKVAPIDETIQHKKQEYLATENEKKLLFALQKVLNDKYLIHCQTSLIAIVEPVNFKDKSKAYCKRMDFVITDTATKILAVIELDDSSHNQPKRIKRDKYVNDALNPHHPLIRIPTHRFYNPEKIAEILEKNANIKNEFNKNA